MRRQEATEAAEAIGSDLERLDALADADIDTDDAPVPDLAGWVRRAGPFHLADIEDDCGA